jgi:hypothetical protein
MRVVRVKKNCKLVIASTLQKYQPATILETLQLYIFVRKGECLKT